MFNYYHQNDVKGESIQVKLVGHVADGHWAEDNDAAPYHNFTQETIFSLDIRLKTKFVSSFKIKLRS